MDELDQRIKILKDYGAKSSEIDELLIYNENQFQKIPECQNLLLPLADELHIQCWQKYLIESKSIGVFQALKKRLVQLNFPIATGISSTESYKAATRRGELLPNIEAKDGLTLKESEKLELRLHPTLAGTIPVIIAHNRQDFVSLVQAIAKKNEPQPLPDSMGACIIGGYNNWDRIRQYKQEWSKRNPLFNSNADWQREFKKLIKQKELYQDRFIILSRGNYSNVTAKDLNLEAAEWQRLSLLIRLEHECTHYLTRRLLGSMRNNLLDEAIADYQGITAAYGSYQADWFLTFLGLESPEYRTGGRLENYRGTPPLSDGAFQILQKMIKKLAHNLAQFHEQYYLDRSPTDEDRLGVILALTTSTIEQLATTDTVTFLLTKTTEAKTRLGKIKTSVKASSSTIC